jgi:hypothetical protein
MELQSTDRIMAVTSVGCAWGVVVFRWDKDREIRFTFRINGSRQYALEVLTGLDVLSTSDLAGLEKKWISLPESLRPLRDDKNIENQLKALAKN